MVVKDSVSELENIYSELNRLYFPKEKLDNLIQKIINPNHGNNSGGNPHHSDSLASNNIPISGVKKVNELTVS